jgi:hypothetical protein
MYPLPFIGYAAIGVGVLVALLEFPLRFFEVFGPLFTNFYIRGILYLAAGAPMFLSVPTTTGGIGIAVTGLVYLLAAIRGESYQHPSEWGRSPGGRAKKSDAEKVLTVLPAEDNQYVARTLERQPSRLAQQMRQQQRGPPSMDFYENEAYQPSRGAVPSMYSNKYRSNYYDDGGYAISNAGASSAPMSRYDYV